MCNLIQEINTLNDTEIKKIKIKNCKTNLDSLQKYFERNKIEFDFNNLNKASGLKIFTKFTREEIYDDTIR